MRHETDCIFCKIVQGLVPAIKVYEDALTISFMDISPASEGHTLVVSKAHFANLLEIDEQTLTAVALSTRHIAQAIQRALQPDGIRIAQFNGAAAGQTVFHYHVHIVPMRQGQHPELHGRRRANPKDIEAVAEKIRKMVK